LSERVLRAPLTPDEARALRCGDVVFLSGEFVGTAGHPTHKRLVETIERGEAPPIDLNGAAFFHLGSASRESDGRIQPLYVNPTTSTRFNPFIPRIVRHFGITALAGKGGLDAACVAAMQEVGCVYFSMIGGSAPLLTEGVLEVIETGWDDLIMQFRLTRFRIEKFGPLTVAIDAHGHSVYDELTASARSRLPEIVARLNAARPGSAR
jgi:fumarate hydratase subunit beta